MRWARRLDRSKDEAILHHLDPDRYFLLANTAGCFNATDAVRAPGACRRFSEWVKLQVSAIKKHYCLIPELLEATRILADEGFRSGVHQRRSRLGAEARGRGRGGSDALASPIGSGLRMLNPQSAPSSSVLRASIVDAGVGTASDACVVMEQGVDGILMNTGIAAAEDPVRMAAAMKAAVDAGRNAYLAGRMPRREVAVPSSPTVGMLGSAP